MMHGPINIRSLLIIFLCTSSRLKTTIHTMSNTKHFDYDLLKSLQCPVCLEYMLSHITLCENGHNICTNCRSTVSDCPSCKGRFLQVRNIALEDIAQNAIYPCKNRPGGCNEVLSVDDKVAHESSCLYETRVCPFTKLTGDSCAWTGVMSQVGAHVRCDHGCQTQNSLGIFVLKLETLCASKHYMQAVFAFGELFFIFWKTKECHIQFAVFHAGPKTDTEEFTYKFSVKRDNEKISMRAICHSYLQETSTVLQPGECVFLPYGTMLKYLSKNSDLSCDIKIRRCPKNPVFRALSKWFEDQGPPPSKQPNTAPISVTNIPMQLPDDTAQPSTVQNP